MGVLLHTVCASTAGVPGYRGAGSEEPQQFQIAKEQNKYKISEQSSPQEEGTKGIFSLRR